MFPPILLSIPIQGAQIVMSWGDTLPSVSGSGCVITASPLAPLVEYRESMGVPALYRGGDWPPIFPATAGVYILQGRQDLRLFVNLRAIIHSLSRRVPLRVAVCGDEIWCLII